MGKHDSQQPVPDFLIIGAQKAGTTTLYRDLLGHPGIFLPQDKEPFTLTKFGDDDQRIKLDYASLFRPASETQAKGEASTSYTMRPTYEGVASRALRICGPDLKVIYVQREPISRLVSQYRHEYGGRQIDGSLEESVLDDPRYVAYSSYEYQLAPWRETFSADRLLVLDFEQYVADRMGTLAKVAKFIGVDPTELRKPESDRIFNPSSGKPVATGLVRRAIETKLYQRIIKPVFPWWIRDRAMHALLPRARASEKILSREVEATLRERIARRNGVPDLEGCQR